MAEGCGNFPVRLQAEPLSIARSDLINGRRKDATGDQLPRGVGYYHVYREI